MQWSTALAVGKHSREITIVSNRRARLATRLIDAATRKYASPTHSPHRRPQTEHHDVRGASRRQTGVLVPQKNLLATASQWHLRTLPEGARCAYAASYHVPLVFQTSSVSDSSRSSSASVWCGNRHGRGRFEKMGALLVLRVAGIRTCAVALQGE